MVRVCDCVMGTGKSSAAITYINEHPGDRFIYITPYLDEATRIRKNCPDANFVEPSTSSDEYEHKKTTHTAALIKEGKNIASTHQAFKGYTPAMLDDVKRQGYTLIIDENVDLLERFDIQEDDLKLAVDAGYIIDDGGIFRSVKEDYKGTALRDLFRIIKSRELIRVEDKNNTLFYWVLPPELILAFKDVFVLTYLFSGQSIHHFLEIYNIPYEFVGIEKLGDRKFRFCEPPGYVPEYVHKLKDMVHILDNEKLNSIGDNYYALSMSWFDKPNNAEQMKRNMYNCFRNIWSDVPLDKKMWGTYASARSKLRGKGYSNAYLVFNTKATNEYKNRTHLIYSTNLFMNVEEKKFYYLHGIDVDEDMYALSIMIQWIWRSEIRDGGEIHIYVPSKRMRTLLMNWIDSVSKGGSDDE